MTLDDVPIWLKIGNQEIYFGLFEGAFETDLYGRVNDITLNVKQRDPVTGKFVDRWYKFAPSKHETVDYAIFQRLCESIEKHCAGSIREYLEDERSSRKATAADRANQRRFELIDGGLA